MLLFAVGIVYVKAYMNMAKRNSKENEPERHLILKILGGFWAVMAVIMGCMGVYMITQISFPQEAIGPFISPNMIVRSSYQTMYWGYATFPQSQCISVISGVFEFLALSAYCFLFKSSHSKWYGKLGKIVFCILFYMFFASATDFHYFDLHEWTAPVLFAIMAFFAFRNKQEESIEPIVEENKMESLDTAAIHEENNDSTSNVGDDSKYMPRIDVGQDVLSKSDEDLQESENNQLPESIALEVPSVSEVEQLDSSIVNEDSTKKQSVENPASLDQVNTDQVIKFCRHCDGKLDYQSDKFCKHCGKQLYEKNINMKYCRYCGKPIDDDSTFCTHCGKGQSVQNNYISVEKFGDIVSRIWSKTKNLKTKFVFPKGSSNTTFVCIKKCIKRIVIILIVATILGLFVLLGFWLYGFYLTSKWTREDERREIISMKDISKADSIVRVLFQEYADGTHRYDVDGECCNYSHVEKGIEILRNAAEKGDADAQFTLGAIYAGAHYEFHNPYFRDGITMLGEEVDLSRAAYWYTLSANQGHKSALNNLGLAYKNGNGVNKDLIKATEYIRKSAEMGNALAQLNYGDMFRDGEVWFQTNPDSISGESFLINAKPNIERAKEWWEKALQNGNDNAKRRLEKIYE